MMKKMAGYFSTAYLMLMFCIYPFYIEKGYTNIGEAKNRFFVAVSLAAFGVLSVCYGAEWFRRIKENKKNGQAYLIDWTRVSIMDLLVLCYATVIFLSYVFSFDRGEALWGTRGWYMGAVPILLLCALYFLISRLWQGERVVIYGIIVASALVFLLGVCNRFSVYPFTFDGAQPDFISTLGNINWFCGFLSVTASVGVVLFVVKGDCLRKFIGAVLYVLITFMAGFAQGSDSIFLWYGAVFFLLLWISLERKEYLLRWFFLVFIWGISAQLVRGLRILTVDKYNYDTGGFCGYFTDSSLSLWIAAAALIGGIVVSLQLIRKKDIFLKSRNNAQDDGSVCKGNIRLIGMVRKGLLFLGCFLIAGYLALALIHTKWGLSFLQGKDWFVLDENWGDGRGVTFFAGFKIWWEADFLHKLIGVGPDCFSVAAYEIPSLATMLRAEFGSARLTNAHNEILTALANTGVLGVSFYLGILIHGIVKFVKAGKENCLLYAFSACLFGYLIHNMVSFAQVLNFPYIFLILGMGESMLRNRKIDDL